MLNFYNPHKFKFGLDLTIMRFRGRFKGFNIPILLSIEEE
jgi:hypothetical protein